MNQILVFYYSLKHIPNDNTKFTKISYLYASCHAKTMGAAIFRPFGYFQNFSLLIFENYRSLENNPNSKMAAASVSFEDWLGERLTSLNPEVDTEVFVTYITGILETETDEEDTRESILGILGEVLVKPLF